MEAAIAPRPMADARTGQQGTPTRIRAPRGSRPRAPRDTRCTRACIFGAVWPRARRHRRAGHALGPVCILGIPL
jgi:hypothetical protein